jgi:hypothetical protein
VCVCVCVFLWGFVSLNLTPHPLWSSSSPIACLCVELSPLSTFFVLPLCIHTTHFCFYINIRNQHDQESLIYLGNFYWYLIVS